MITLKRNKDKKILQDELDQLATVCSHRGMQTVKANCLTIHPKMIRLDEPSLWNGKEVYCLIFPYLENDFYNNGASRVMNREILGNCILLSKDGISNVEIREFLDLNPKNKLANNWIGMAQSLPSFIELDEEIKQRKADEIRQRHKDWDEAIKLKQQRREAYQALMNNYTNDEKFFYKMYEKEVTIGDDDNIA